MPTSLVVILFLKMIHLRYGFFKKLKITILLTILEEVEGACISNQRNATNKTIAENNTSFENEMNRKHFGTHTMKERQLSSWPGDITFLIRFTLLITNNNDFIKIAVNVVKYIKNNRETSIV